MTMTELNEQTRELNIDELDAVSGGLLWCRPGDDAPIATAASYGIAVGQAIAGYRTGGPLLY
jgi:hypothetical protein